MEQKICEILENVEIANNTFKMVLTCSTKSIKRPGQFINVALDNFYLRRPISVCDYDKESITIIYKILGEGTDAMAKLAPKTKLDCLLGLGNGFDIALDKEKALIIGGGVGVPPLYKLAIELVKLGKTPQVVLGFNTAGDAILIKEFLALGCKVTTATLDGSLGHKGFVTDVIDGVNYDYFYACGPLAMLKAVAKATNTSGQISMEERMGCGFGACMGCSIMTTNGAKRVCKEGPVFIKEELIW